MYATRQWQTQVVWRAGAPIAWYGGMGHFLSFFAILEVISVSMFTCTVKSSYSNSSIRSFNWMTVLVPVYCWGRNNLLSDSATVGGDIPHSAGCYLTFFWLAKQATSKLAKSLSSGENMDGFTVCTLHIRLYFWYKVVAHFPPVLMGFFVFVLTFFYKFMLFKLRVKDHGRDYRSCSGCLGQTRSGWGTCRSNSTSSRIIWMC